MSEGFSWPRKVPKEMARERRGSFEERATIEIARRCGATAPALRRLAKQLYGEPEIRLALLGDLDESPSAVFRVCRLLKLHELSAAEFFRCPARTPPIEAYMREFDGVSPDEHRPCVLVFGWPQVAPMACVHNYAYELGPSSYRDRKKGRRLPGCRLQAALPREGRNDLGLTLEPLHTFLEDALGLWEDQGAQDEDDGGDP